MPQILNDRTKMILEIIEPGPLPIIAILEELIQSGFSITRITLNRDLKSLEEARLVSQLGQGRATVYQLSELYKLIRPIDFVEYFQVDPDDRKVQEEFNFGVYSVLGNVFSEQEMAELEQINSKYRSNVSQLSSTLFHKELERLTIELSWKSSKLEGNTYTLLDTERLIKEGVESRGHSAEEATMILNHKNTIDYIIQNKDSYKQLDLKKIQKIHSLLIKDLNVPSGIRDKKIGIIGTKYRPLQRKPEIKKALEQLCDVINAQDYPLLKALLAVAMISYIQAFEDGNKRTARILSTAILLAYDYCPLSYRSVDEFDYKKSMILFYEQNNLYFLKLLFVDQFRFSVETYF